MGIKERMSERFIRQVDMRKLIFKYYNVSVAQSELSQALNGGAEPRYEKIREMCSEILDKF